MLSVAGGTFVNIALWGAKRVALDMTVMLFGERRYMAGMLNVCPGQWAEADDAQS